MEIRGQIRKIGKERQDGSVCVEASLATTLFLFFFLSLFAFYNILLLEMKLQNALEYTADIQSAWAVASMDTDMAEHKDEISFLKCTLDQIYTRSSVTSIAGKEFLDRSFIKGGASGIDYGYSRYLEDGEYLELIAVYKVRIPYYPIPDIKIIQGAKRRVWFGYDGNEKKKEDSKNTQDHVYVTPNGSAYHLYADCSYLDVKLHEIDASMIQTKRNADGGKYYPCESCKPDAIGSVYISNYGSRYHNNTSCKAIEKDAREINASDIGGRHLCSRCTKRKEGHVS